MRRYSDNDTIYIYGLCDPLDKVIRYVGWAGNVVTRLKGHISESKHDKKTHKHHWINHLIKNGRIPEAIILEECQYCDREPREMYWIAYYKGNNLTNATLGGEGQRGLVHSEEMKRKAAERGYKRRHTPEELVKMSKSMKGKKKTKEGLDNLSKAVQGNKNNVGASGYVGVRKSKKSKNWRAYICQNGKTVDLGTYENKKDAAIAYDIAAFNLFGEDAKTNFPKEVFLNHSPSRIVYSSIYAGVSFNKATLKWTGYVNIENETRYLGTFSTEKEAAFAHDYESKLRGIDKYINNVEISEEEKIGVIEIMDRVKKDRLKEKSSEYIGITKKINHWRVRITNNEGERIYLGSFPTETEAALAYNEAAEYFYGYKAKLNNIPQSEIDNLWND